MSYLHRWNHKRSERARACLHSHEYVSVSTVVERSPPKTTLSNSTQVHPDSFRSARPLASTRKESTGQTEMMTIEKLVHGDGYKGKDKRFLSRKQIFPVPSRQSGLGSFWPIDLIRRSLFEHIFRVPTYEVLAQTPAAKRVSRN